MNKQSSEGLFQFSS